ncbi:MAG: methionine adenosyltransferase [Candidatus Aquicultorales bacterium]
MRRILVEDMKQPLVSERDVEIVERKGVGHPDSICDSIMEEISISLSREYIAQFGQILHHNIDKGLLVAGQVRRALGGGKVEEPMRLFIGDRATFDFDGRHLDVDSLAVATARKWIRDNLRFVDPLEDVIVESELRPGSAELSAAYLRGDGVLPANDTSAAVGYAPLTDTERIVLETERFLNSYEFKRRHPATGEDVKIMAFRVQDGLTLTVSMPVIDRFVSEISDYWSIKSQVEEEIVDFVLRNKGKLGAMTVDVNALDDPKLEMAGVYLTVTGTSAEDADSGEVGRGNRANGVIAFNRPIGTEAAAGKNPAGHVGKIYSILAHRIAREVHAGVEGLAEVYIWMGSQIGKPIDEPKIIAAQLVLEAGVACDRVAGPVREIIDFELSEMSTFTNELAEGRYRIW